MTDDASQNPAQPTAAPVKTAPLVEVRYEYTPTLPGILHRLGATLLISTYQAGKVLALGSTGESLSVTYSHFDRAMGLAVDRTRIAVGTRRQIHFLKSAPDLGPRIDPAGTYDGCWLPRASFYTGNIHGHELAWGNDGLWVVNTLFSTLCTLHEDYSFVPRWRPRFISELQGQDRCHLNGLAIVDGQPRFVTAMAESNEPGGWRSTKATTGCVIDVTNDEVLVRGLAMPHSPRLYKDRLWVLNSGYGQLGFVDQKKGQYESVEKVPGYTRGLTFAGQFAFVGLSRIRETSIFGGIPIAEHREQLKCGVAVIDLKLGRTVAVFQFHSGVEEIFALEILPQTNAYVTGPAPDRDDAPPDIWLVPEPGARLRPEPERSLHARPAETPPEPTQKLVPATTDQLVAAARRFQETGQLAEAAACLKQAISSTTAPAVLLVDLGNIQQELGDQDAALNCYREATQKDPHLVAAWQNYCYLLFNRGLAVEAVRAYEHLIRLDSSPLNHLLSAVALPVIYDSLKSVKQWRDRLDCALTKMLADDMTVDANRQLLPTSFFVAYAGLNDRNVMQKFGGVIRGSSCSQRQHPGRSGSRGRIRLAVMSAYLHDHTIGRLNIGRLEQLNRDQFELHVVYAGRATDAMQQRFQATAEHFHRIPRNVAAAQKQIAAIDADILLFTDVGMDALTSTLAYSRMAPIQCTTWGHPETTGSPFMDYFISSELLEIPEADDHYTEKLVRLPLSGTWYERPERTGPDRNREFFGLPTNRRIYLCPQSLFKFHPAFDEVLAGVLTADPQAELVVLNGRVPVWTEQLNERWKTALPDAESRVRFLPAVPRDDFLALLQLADVVLDPYPFGGGNSSYEALAVGAPVVTLPTPYLRGRITQALCRKLGDTSSCVSSPQEYVRTAVTIAQNDKDRVSIRRKLADAARVLFEDPQEVRVLEQFFHQAIEMASSES